jgi:hypothetical protein
MVIEFKNRDEQVESKKEWVLVTRDGNQIVAMVGRDLQAGIGGFGNTVAAALRDPADRMEAERYMFPGIDFWMDAILLAILG